MALMTIAETSSSSSSSSPRRKLRDDDLYLTANKKSSAAGSTPLVISVIASLIERTVARNARISKNYGLTTSSSSSSKVFECRRGETPEMSVQSYLERVFRYTGAGPSVFVIAYVYIDRLCHLHHPHLRIGPTNVHRLLITSILLASKYVEDMNYKNSYYARVGGVTREEMNKMEVELLFKMGFRLHVNVSVFESYWCHLQREVNYGGGYHIERTLIQIHSQTKTNKTAAAAASTS